ncbi:flagellar biosynthetic protein FliR [Celeribacter marinus]|uniref:Flagellar biosynthesis protein FliR n=1 Tax=Celeribacter marinus TaxID=1397108 RepID=A0A0N9ZIW4_9RHOB|nr:flagellar biosynthetic protein FliR [Celeribacter marinus]ALI55670.1 flagellar biosynthesis protein FliR [Celeribacter marinus]SFK25711.1 flagellar biosynthetic protein FliR [Celeribacter marinus]
MEYLETLSQMSQPALIAAFLVFVRVGASMAALPAFGEQTVSVRVRLALTLAFTAIVFPAVAIDPFILNTSLVVLGPSMLAEVVSGLTIGIIVRLSVMALQIAGTIISQSTSLSQLFGGGAVDAQPAMGYILFTAGLALAVTLGLHERIALLLIQSYDLFPAGKFPDPRDLSLLMVGHVAHAFALAFSFSGPFLIASVIYNTALGVINRAMPQLMVALVGAPAITLGGLILLFLTAPLLLEIWIEHFYRTLQNPLGIF